MIIVHNIKLYVTIPDDLPKNFRFTGEKTEKIEKNPIFSHHDFLLKKVRLKSISSLIFQYINMEFIECVLEVISLLSIEEISEYCISGYFIAILPSIYIKNS